MTKKEAVSLLEGEIIRCRMAPKINGCPMTEEWQLTIDVCQIAIDAIREQEQRRWIPVTERLPEESGMYIVTANDGYAQRVSFVLWQKRNRMWNLTGARSYWRVTHWMPLPEPPEE